MDYLKSLVRGSKRAAELTKCLENEGSTVHLEQMVGGAYSLYAATMVEQTRGIHVFVAEDRDSAAYLVNDFYELLDEERVAFFCRAISAPWRMVRRMRKGWCVGLPPSMPLRALRTTT